MVETFEKSNKGQIQTTKVRKSNRTVSQKRMRKHITSYKSSENRKKMVWREKKEVNRK